MKQKARFNAALAAEDPTNEIAAAHAVKERLRLLLAEHQPHQIRRRLYDFYDAAARADMEETSRLATTIDTWWPAGARRAHRGLDQRPHRGLQPDHQANKRVGCGFTTWTTTEGASWSTSPSPEGRDQQHEISTRPAQMRRAQY